MISVYIREQKRYTQPELCNLLAMDANEIVPVLRRLKEYGVARVVDASGPQGDFADLSDESTEIADVIPGDTNYYYVFVFVGVVVIAGRGLSGSISSKTTHRYVRITRKTVCQRDIEH